MLQDKDCSWHKAIAVLSASAFVGWVVSCFLNYWGWPVDLHAPVGAMTGTAARPLLDAFSDRLCKLVRTTKL